MVTAGSLSGVILHILLLYNSPTDAADAGTTTTTTTSGKAAAANVTCAKLRTTLGAAAVILPTDALYANLSVENWSQTAWKQPACIVVPSDTTQVQAAIRRIAGDRVPLAVRSGGHSANPYDAAIDSNGILIATEKLSSVSYDATRNTASFGPGARWGEVYGALDPFRVTVVGGRVRSVGVGGLVLGSGLSYLTDLYGLACDNVRSYEVVLGDGRVVEVTETRHSDLFWALKGGGNNFGIVTKFTVTTYPIHQVWGGVHVYTAAQAPQVLQALHRYQSQPNKDLHANLVVNVVPTNDTVLLTLVYLKPVERPAAYAPFYGLNPILEQTGIMPLSTLLTLFPDPSLPRWSWWTTSFKPDSALYDQIGNLVATAPETATIRALTGGTLVATVQPITENAVLAGRQANSVGGNALGLQAVNQTWFALNAGWWHAADDGVANAAVESLLSKAKSLAEAAGEQIEYLFMNDANAKQEVIGSYGKRNARRLAAVREAYDPLGVFTRLVRGGQKIPDVF